MIKHDLTFDFSTYCGLLNFVFTVIGCLISQRFQARHPPRKQFMNPISIVGVFKGMKGRIIQAISKRHVFKAVLHKDVVRMIGEQVDEGHDQRAQCRIGQRQGQGVLDCQTDPGSAHAGRKGEMLIRIPLFYEIGVRRLSIQNQTQTRLFRKTGSKECHIKLQQGGSVRYQRNCKIHKWHDKRHVRGVL